MGAILAACVLSMLAGLAMGWWAWRDHFQNLDAFEVISRTMTREHRARIRRDIKSARRSRKAGTMDDVVWVRELEGDRR